MVQDRLQVEVGIVAAGKVDYLKLSGRKPVTCGDAREKRVF